MTDIEQFISDARAKNKDDDAIREALAAQGWDKSVVEMALSGLTVPKPASRDKEQAQTPAPAHNHATLSPLIAALHHVLLWFFIASSTVTITAVVASLFGTRVSSTALTSMIAVTAVTFTPYAVLFVLYLLKLRRQPGLVPGRVWSIITVCLHSVAAMIAGITLIVSLINGSPMGASVPTSAALILLLDVLVIFTYSSVGFAPSGSRLRTIAAWLYVPALLVLLGSLTVLSVAKLGPAKYDEQLRKNLVTSAESIRQYAQDHHVLPPADQADVEPNVEYKTTGTSTYELCATFKTNSGERYSSYYSTPDDMYVSEYQFEAPSGHQCFTFQSSPLRSESYPVR